MAKDDKYSRPEINWERIGKAVQFYKDLGYQYMEVPWFASEEATRVTHQGSVLSCKYGNLLGSAEQAFIDQMLSGNIEYGTNLIAVSPCFREEDKYTKLNHLSFMKVELFRLGPDFGKLLNDAFNFYQSLGIEGLYKESFLERNMDYTTDILGGRNSIELGSYGGRTYHQFSWSYGTGLAEPRCSQVELDIF